MRGTAELGEIVKLQQEGCKKQQLQEVGGGGIKG